MQDIEEFQKAMQKEIQKECRKLLLDTLSIIKDDMHHRGLVDGENASLMVSVIDEYIEKIKSIEEER